MCRRNTARATSRRSRPTQSQRRRPGPCSPGHLRQRVSPHTDPSATKRRSSTVILSEARATPPSAGSSSEADAWRAGLLRAPRGDSSACGIRMTAGGGPLRSTRRSTEGAGRTPTIWIGKTVVSPTCVRGRPQGVVLPKVSPCADTRVRRDGNLANGRMRVCQHTG
jgi:hypothetical protein